MASAVITEIAINEFRTFGERNHTPLITVTSEVPASVSESDFKRIEIAHPASMHAEPIAPRLRERLFLG